MLTKTKFIGFLKDMNCLKEYKENIANFHNQNIDDIWDKVIAGDLKCRNLIDSFFTWSYTKQGQDYWSAIDGAWKALVEKDEKESKNIPVYELTYSRTIVCKVFCPKISAKHREIAEELMRNKHPEITTIWRSGDYLIGDKISPSGLVKSV